MEYDHETANPPGRSPHVLDIGADTDSTEVTSTLSSHGSSPSAVDRSGKSSLFTARSPRENDVGLQQLFSESCAGKIWRTAAHLIPDKVGKHVQHALTETKRKTNALLGTGGNRPFPRIRLIYWIDGWKVHYSRSQILDLRVFPRQFVLSS